MSRPRLFDDASGSGTWDMQGGYNVRMMNISLKGKPWLQALCFMLCAGGYFWIMSAHRAVELADDGAFFLRYAQNMMNGHFWVWNVGEAPIWGASAPLFPLFLAGPLLLGFDPVSTVIMTGIAAGAIGFAVIAVLLATQVGVISGVVFFVMSAASSQMTYWVGSGLETPLTVLLLTVALFAVLGSGREWVLGLAAGFLAIHKLDMIPVAGLILLAGWVRDGKLPVKAAGMMIAMATVWYGFAWWYFGSPIPNSFITKAIHQRNLPAIIDWRWFGQFVLLSGVNKFMTVCLVGLCWVRVSLKPILLVFGGLLAIHLVAYTIKHPIEPYAWYGMAAMLSLAILASIAVQSLSERMEAVRGFRSWGSFVAPVVVLGIVTAYFFHVELARATALQKAVALYEGDRGNAGRWVAKNTPSSFVVMAGHGNPAYFSQRKVIDSSFLNRKFDPSNAFETLRPEIFVSGGNPTDPEFKSPLYHNYQVVKVFDRTLSEGMDKNYWFAVLARKDVISQMTDVDVGRTAPVLIEEFVSRVELGDVYGVVRQEGKNTLFVHPGATAPTRFFFDVKRFASGRKSVQFDANVSPSVPKEAIERGAASVRIVLLKKGQPMAEGTVSSGHPFHFAMPVGDDDAWQVVVDNLNGPDTDWILVSFN